MTSLGELSEDHRIIAAVLAALQTLEVVRFTAAATVVAHLYNTILHLDEDVNYVRKTSLTPAKVVYLLDQYVSLAVMLLLLYISSGFASIEMLTDETKTFIHLLIYSRCRSFIVCLVVIAALGSIAAGNFVVISYVWGLWDNAVWVKRGTVSVMVVSYAAMVPMVVLRLVQGLPIVHARHIGTHNFCLIGGRSTIQRVFWLPPLMVDLTSFALFLLNAGHRPRRASSSLMRIVYRQGILYFVSMLAIHVVNCALSSSTRTAVFIPGTIFCWGVNLILVRKLVLAQARAEEWKTSVSSCAELPMCTKDDDIDMAPTRSFTTLHKVQSATQNSPNILPTSSENAGVISIDSHITTYDDNLLYREWRRED